MLVKKLRAQGYLREEELKQDRVSQQANTSGINSSLGMSNSSDQSKLGHPLSTGNDGKVSLVFAKLDDGITWKNEFDIFNASTGQLFSQVREGEVGGLTKVARMGTASVNSKFDVMFKSPDGTAQFRCRNKGLTGSTCEILSPEGAILGEVKTEMGFQMKSTLTETGGGNIYQTKGNGVGKLCTKHEITKNGQSIGEVASIDESEARVILGMNFSTISGSRKYDYAYHVTLGSSQENLPLILGRVYHIGHMTQA